MWVSGTSEICQNTRFYCPQNGSFYFSNIQTKVSTCKAIKRSYNMVAPIDKECQNFRKFCFKNYIMEL
jgi:hypothetical protein